MSQAEPLNVLVIPGLTLSTVTPEQEQQIQAAAGASSTITVASFADAPAHIENADVVLGIVPPELFARAKRLRWVQSIS